MTITVLHDGAAVATGTVSCLSEVARFVLAHRPRQARGGVITLADDEGSDVIATSVHSAGGPQWSVRSRKLADRIVELS